MNKFFILLFAAGTLIFASCGSGKKTETKTTTTSDSLATPHN